MTKVQLFKAVKEGDKAKITEQLESGVDINSLDEFGQNVLHLAVNNNKHEIIQYLISLGAKINFGDQFGWTPLYAACLKSLECAKVLLANGADANIGSKDIGNTPLMAAVDKGDQEMINLLIKNNAQIDTASKAGWTALHSAADSFANHGGNGEIIRLLISYNAKNLPNCFGHTPKDIVATCVGEEEAEVFNPELPPLLGNSLEK